MPINLDYLHTFITAIDEGSFSAAGRSLKKAQSAVSTSINNLEIDLNVTLFDRTGRAPQLTAEGKALEQEARRLLEQAKQLTSHARCLANDQEGALTLALSESLISIELETTLTQFADTFPQLELEILHPTGPDITELVSQGRVDIGVLIAELVPQPLYRIYPLGEMAMSFVVSSSHPLANVSHLSLEDLYPHRQLVLATRQHRHYIGERLGTRLWKVESAFTQIELVKRTVGWAWLPSHMVQQELAAGTLKQLVVNDQFSQCHMPIDMITSHHYNEGLAGQWLLKRLPQLPFLKS